MAPKRPVGQVQFVQQIGSQIGNLGPPRCEEARAVGDHGLGFGSEMKPPNQSIEPTGGSRFRRSALVSPGRLPPVAHANRSPEPVAAPPMSRTSSDRSARQTRDTSSGFSPDPCDPCHPWFIPGLFLNHGSHGFHGWARHWGRGLGSERANQSVEATATRSPCSMMHPDVRSGVSGRRASPWRSAARKHTALCPDT